MSNLDHLPEHYRGEGNQPVAAPTYEALMQCQIILATEVNGQLVTGPTLIEAGEHFTTEAIPCMQWMPLNRAAGEVFEAWLESLPAAGAGITHAEFQEAAMMMRPRVGEPEVPHHQWWEAVVKLAEAKKKAKSGMTIPRPLAGVAHRPGMHLPAMPYAAAGPGVPLDQIGRAPQPQAAVAPQMKHNNAATPRKGRPMAATSPTDSPRSAAG